MNRDSSKLRRFVHAAREVGYSKEERRELAQSPADFFAHDDYSGIREALTPEALASFADTLSGGKGDRKALLTLGNALYEIQGGVWQESEERWGDGEQRPIPENVQRILSLGFKMVENALYEGTLVSLSSEGKAVLAFLLNRIAKMKEKKSVASEQIHFDPKKFEALLERITAFATNFLSPETINHAVAKNEKEQDQIQKDWEASDHPLLKEWSALRRAQQATQEHWGSYKAPGFFDAYFSKLRQHLHDVPALWAEIFGKGEEHYQIIEDFLTYLNDPSVGDHFLQSLPRPPFYIDSRNGEKEWRSHETAGYLHAHGAKIHGERKSTVWDINGKWAVAREAWQAIERLGDVYYNLEQFRIKHTPKGKTARITDMRDLADQMRARKITDDMLTTLEELRRSGGPCLDAWNTLTEIYDLREKMKELQARIVADPSLCDIARKKDDLIAQHAHLLSLQEKRTALQEQVNDSRDTIMRSLDLPAGGAYFVKTLLIAADQRTKQEAESSQRFFSPTLIEKKEPVPVHTFLKVSDRRSFTFAEAHYRATHIPFMQFAVEYLRHSATSREEDNTIETTKE